MSLLPNPYQELPYNTLKRLEWSYLDKCVTTPVNHLIAETMQLITDEAVADGQPELTNEAFLYDRFKNNCSNNMWYGNWQVLKYFSRLLRIKLYREMIGEWHYTDQDVEMYEYFSTVSVADGTKCSPTLMSCDSGKDPNYNDILGKYSDSKYNIKYDCFDAETNVNTIYGDGVGRGLKCQGFTATYYRIFKPSFVLLNDMVRNCRGEARTYPDKGLFTIKHDGKFYLDVNPPTYSVYGVGNFRPLRNHR